MVLLWFGWNYSILIIGFQRRLAPFSALHHNNKHSVTYYPAFSWSLRRQLITDGVLGLLFNDEDSGCISLSLLLI